MNTNANHTVAVPTATAASLTVRINRDGLSAYSAALRRLDERFSLGLDSAETYRRKLKALVRVTG